MQNGNWDHATPRQMHAEFEFLDQKDPIRIAIVKFANFKIFNFASVKIPEI